jgi:D-arabinan endo alpha-(1,5)-arabinofuranosidase
MSFVTRVTGPGVTERVNMVSADLGVVAYDPKRKAFAYVFGDNFSERYLRGEWQSPSILMYDADHNLLGIPSGTSDIVESGNRRQALDYAHNAGGISTILPCDMMRVRGRWVMSAMIVGMGGLGDEKATQFFESSDLVRWTKVDPSLEHPGHPGNVMLTHDEGDDGYVYIFGTGGLARNRPIWLWRCPANTFPGGWWEPWGLTDGQWTWGNPNEHTPILGGRYGELSFRFIQGQSVLSFFDVDNYSCSALTQARPTDDWTRANRIDYARGPEVFQLYGGYICPDSRLNQPNGMKFIVSQWNTQNNDPYHVIAFHDTLQAAGPLVDVKPKPEPEPLPKPKPPPPEEGQMTPQALYELLLRELSASGSEPIVTPDGEKITLRQAVEQIYWKERGDHGLEGRPRHPNKTDDQLGHVLNARAEGLFTQACVVALAEKAGIDAGKLYAQVQGAFPE